jgi:hypothetical protein
LLRDKKIGPLEGFRSKAGWPFTSEIVIKYDDEAHNYKLEFDFGDDKKAEESGELVEFEDASPGRLPQCGGRRARARQQLRVQQGRAHRRAAHAQLRLQERQDHPAAARGARADDQAAGHRQDRPARQVREHAHAPRLQGPPGVGQGGGQGQL